MYNLFNILTQSSLYDFNVFEIAMNGISTYIYLGLTLFVLYIVLEPEFKRLYKKKFFVNKVVSFTKISTLVTYLLFIIQGVL